MVVSVSSFVIRHGDVDDGDDDTDDDDTIDDTDDDDDDYDTDDDNDHKNYKYTAAGAAPGASVPCSLSRVPGPRVPGPRVPRRRGKGVGANGFFGGSGHRFRNDVEASENRGCSHHNSQIDGIILFCFCNRYCELTEPEIDSRRQD